MTMSNPSNGKRPASTFHGFRSLEPKQRLSALGDAVGLSENQRNALQGNNSLPLATANGMIENVIGKFELPLGVATNFLINDKDYLIPMAVEEPSVIAAASYMAKIVRQNGGFEMTSTPPIMRAQIQILNLSNLEEFRQKLNHNSDKLIAMANSKDKHLISLGGGCQSIETHIFEDTPIGPMLILHLLVDVRDAMGANIVNTMAETIAPLVEEITGGTVRLRILSNLADKRLVRGQVRISPKTLDTDTLNGQEIAQGIVEACALAIVDPYRAATHNKGVMNGIDPLVIATGNDWRAIEAGAHAWAAQSGRYTALTNWTIDTDGFLVGTIELPMALGIVGGATKTHPAAQAALAVLKISSAQELGQVAVAVGLAQNMAALRALATEGIQKGHMALHARNIAINAGAKGADIDLIAKELAASGNINVDGAREILARL